MADPAQSAERELVLRIMGSRSFARSERLATLLKYVCDMTFKGREGDLNEQKIGQAVFSRSPDYDSSADGIVRTQASRLRQRLELYFEEEGIGEPIRLIIPKGGYVPVFMPRPVLNDGNGSSRQETVSASTSEMTSSDIVPVAPESMRRLVPWLVGALLICVVLIVVLAGVLLRHRAAAGSAALPPHPLWSQLFSPQRVTLEVPGDSGLVMFHRFDGRHISLNEYLLEEFRSAHLNSPDHETSSEMKELRADIAGRRYTSIVDLDAAVTLAQIAQASHSVLQVRYARDLRPNDLKNGNAILLGAFEANPWIELFEPRMNFILDNDYRRHIFSVINKSPRAGEPDHWESVGTDPQRKVYGVVAYVPNISGNGNVLIVEGTAMAGTEAAWDFVSDDSVLLPFLKKIQHNDGKIPHFELLLGTQNMGSSAVHSDLLSWRLAD